MNDNSQNVLSKNITKNWWILADFLLTAFPFTLLLVLGFSEITLFMNQVSEKVIETLIPNVDVVIERTPFLNSDVSFLSFSGGHPTELTLLVWTIVSFAIIIATALSKIAIPFKQISYFLSLILIATCATLYFFPHAFPYDIGNFAAIDMKLEIILWFIFPILIWTLLLQVTSNIGIKFLFMSCLMGFMLIFSTMKYIFSLYVLVKGSFVFIPIMFFLFGPYMDLVYLVGFFALFTSLYAANKGTAHA